MWQHLRIGPKRPGPRSRWPYLEQVASLSLRAPLRDGENSSGGGEGREEQELSGRWGSPQCEPRGWPWPTWCCPAGVSLGLPPPHCPACASVGPRRLRRVPTAPGRPLLPPRAGGVASPRGPRGHTGDAGGGLAAAPCLRQRGPDLLEALDGCPQQVRSWSPGRWPRGQRTMGWWPLRWPCRADAR